MILVRKAAEEDRRQIAYCIAEAFEKDFSSLCKNTQRVADAIESGIQVERFYVAQEAEAGLVGALALTDCGGRALRTDAKAYRKHFGLVKGTLAALVLKEEFEKPLEYPETVGFLEFVCVRKSWQRRGVTTRMLEYVTQNAGYAAYELDVTNINEGAIQCYQKFGFVEYKRKAVKFSGQKGFNELIIMRCQKG